MSESRILLKSVDELRVDSEGGPLRYFVPAYQRGYRWSVTQVTQLLDDVREFTKRENPQPKEFYCLQPLVLLKRADGAYEVVDGQQRLTTLLLILRHFNERLTEKYRLPLYRLEYETRPGLGDFLEHPSEEISDSNIDFFHIHQAVVTIAQWFERRESEVEVIKDALLNKAKIIWFQLASEESVIAAFTRLNVGKIPLTNGELIRALFLKRGKDQREVDLQLRIAQEWDMIEQTLQGDAFWGFLSNDIEKRDGRIGFLFDLVAREGGIKLGAEEYGTFNFFSERFKSNGVDLKQNWDDVKRAFMLLEEWFLDRRLFHMVGYLIWAGENVNDLRALASDATKHAFKEKLRSRVFVKAFGAVAPDDLTKEFVADRLDLISYSAALGVRSILLLFNVATLLLNPLSNMRFQFESFKAEDWDIEHVRSTATDRPESWIGQKEWLERCLGYLRRADQNADLQAEIGAFMALSAKEITDAAFDPVYESVLKHFRETGGGEADNGLFNLALLDKGTNRSYKNAVFAVKRDRILSLDRDGVFVPLCTRNVFLKCYNPQVDHVMFWTDQDQDGYRQAMVDTLHTFFTGAWIHE